MITHAIHGSDRLTWSQQNSAQIEHFHYRYVKSAEDDMSNEFNNVHVKIMCNKHSWKAFYSKKTKAQLFSSIYIFNVRRAWPVHNEEKKDFLRCSRNYAPLKG